MGALTVRTVSPGDIQDVCDIYNHYVVNSVATFEENEVSAEDMQKRIKEVHMLNMPWIVVADGEQILGYAYAKTWRPRGAYRFSAEVTVYVAHDAFGKGIGSTLFKSLDDMMKNKDIHCLLGVITLPNDPSVALHEKFGFEKVAHLKEVGYKFNQWLDVGYWQKIM